MKVEFNSPVKEWSGSKMVWGCWYSVMKNDGGINTHYLTADTEEELEKKKLEIITEINKSDQLFREKGKLIIHIEEPVSMNEGLEELLAKAARIENLAEKDINYRNAFINLCGWLDKKCAYIKEEDEK